MSIPNFQSAKNFYLSVAAIIILLSGCSEIDASRQDRILSEIVILYNDLLIEVNKTRDVNPMKEIAAKPVTEKLSLWMAAWEDGNVYLDAELINIDFDNLEIAGTSALVTTSENWSYIYRDLDTQEIAEPRQYISYKMQYKLEKREGQWLITEINILEEI
jgi:hypothetical protein